MIPTVPPFIFGETIRTYFAQSLVSPSRNIEGRNLTSESRALCAEVHAKEMDTIKCWDSLVKYCCKFSGEFLVDCSDSKRISIFKFIGTRVAVGMGIPMGMGIRFSLWGSPYGYSHMGIPIWIPYGFQYGSPNGSHGDLQCIADILILKTNHIDKRMKIHMGIHRGFPHGSPQKSCGYGMGMGMEIPLPRQT